MNKLQQILTDNKPVYEYRVKFAFEPSNEQLSKVTQRLMDRYDAFEVGGLKKTIFMEKPLDFYDLDCGEIWMFDFKCNRGVQSNVLMYEIGNLLSVTEALIRIRSKDEPRQIEMTDLEDDIDFDDYEPVIGVPFGAPEDSTDIAGQERAETAVKDAIDAVKKDNKYSQYMSAGFGKKD
ncbi:hypothetical protein [Escherichia phage vB_EcoM_JNE01]|nr:hypothetical protein [Escherichia phage vB_EcoM_JNE01]